MEVVGTMFFKDRKLLIINLEREIPLEVAIRECHEES